MNHRNGKKGGRFTLKTVHRKRGKTSARKAQRVARSKPNSSESLAVSVPSEPSVPLPENQSETFYVHKDLSNSLEDFRLLDVYQEALRDLMCFYNRVTELDGHGWTAADVKRLEEIRQLLAPYVRTAI